MTPTKLDAWVTILCLILSTILYKCHSRGLHHIPPRAYILRNRITHVRLLPIDTSHSFNNQTISLLLSLKALESHSLDLFGGWVFSYGGLFGRLTGIRAEPYLTADEIGGKERSIMDKLKILLSQKGYDGSEVEDAWIMTMPSYFGWEGINPLTVYFVYNPDHILWLVVLEIHNTFGESHIHVLPIGPTEDPVTHQGYDHQWTFPRSFHVSPFNDRSGFYTFLMVSPTHPPSHSSPSLSPPKPAVRIFLKESQSPTATIKFTASIQPHFSMPLTTSSLLNTLLSHPFTLLLSFPRILANAFVLHYSKGLPIYPRPEPKPHSTTIKYLPETSFEKYTRLCVHTFLSRQVRNWGVEIILEPADPSSKPCRFQPETLFSPKATLTIRNVSPTFYVALFLAPSPAHALLLDRMWLPSDEKLFLAVFSSTSSLRPDRSWTQRLRTYPIPLSLVTSPFLPIPSAHPLDDTSHLPTLRTMTRILMSYAQIYLEHFLFVLARVKVVKGQEPWDAWGRAERRFLNSQEEKSESAGPEEWS